MHAEAMDDRDDRDLALLMSDEEDDGEELQHGQATPPRPQQAESVMAVIERLGPSPGGEYVSHSIETC